MSTGIAERLAVGESEAVHGPVPVGRRRRTRAVSVALGLTGVIAVCAALIWATSWGRESTDDAEVEGHIHNVASRVPGVVAAVLVKDNQAVKTGDILIRLDPADLQARLEGVRAEREAAEAAEAAAEAQLALTEDNVSALLQQAHGTFAEATSHVAAFRADVRQGEANITAARARQQLAAADFERANQLSTARAIPKAGFDAAQAAIDQANAGLRDAEARLVALRATIGAGLGAVDAARGLVGMAQSGPNQIKSANAAVRLARARVEQALAAERLAALNLSYTEIRAPSDGVVARRTAEVGQSVAPDRTLLATVSLADVWIVANFKEDQLAKLRAGQPSDVRVDTYGREVFHGHVESIAPGTGSRFTLLPADNASGNFTKVVQRVPILVAIDSKDNVDLRPGMSATVTVYTR